MNLKNKWIDEFDVKGKVFSAFLSVLTLFAVLGQIAPDMYAQMPEYAEWICGLTTWNAYNKQADMSMIQIALIGLPMLFFVFAGIYVWWNRMTETENKGAGAVFLVSYIAVLCMYYCQKENATQWLLLWGFLFAGYLILMRRKEQEAFGEIAVKSVIVLLFLFSTVLCLNFFTASVSVVWNRLSVILMIAGGVVFFGLVMFEKFRKRAQFLGWLQIFVPLAWLGFVHFRYRYEKESLSIELFYSGKWKGMCLLLCALLLVCAVVEKRKGKEQVLYPTFVTAAAIRVFSQPEGLLNIDYFHNGEITMPIQQLVSFGKLPYQDIIPIHGLCDYYYGLINYLFFDGTYLALNAAKVAGDLLMAVALATVIWAFAEHRLQAFAIVWFFMPFMIRGAGMRYWLLFILFFVLFSAHVRKGMQSLYAWILLSIAAIAWNASIGGAAALAFLPVVGYRACRDLPAQWKELKSSSDKRKRNLIWAFWGLLFGVGIAFIPLFLKIVSYLRENTGTTLYVNGMEMISELTDVSAYFVPGIVNEQGMFWIVTFGFLLPLLIVFAMMFRQEKIGAGEMFVTYLVAFWILANYAFVRYDDGLRSAVLTVFFLLLTAVTILWRNNMQSGKTVASVALYTVVLALAVLLADDAPFVTEDTLVLEKEVPAYVETSIMGQEIEDPVVHVSGELVAIPGLGTGFIQGNTLASLQNVNTLVDAAKKNGQTIFDITNAVANAVLLDMPMYLPYSSAYNISNDMMQEKAISMLEGKLPDIILAAPEIRFDDAPFSYRCVKLYRYLMKQDYVPYKYENVIYLVRGENPLPQADQNWEAFAQLMHKKDLAYLPAVWGSNADRMAEQLDEITTGVQIVGTETGVKIVFETPVSGKELAMIGFSGLSAEAGEQERNVTMVVQSKVASDQTVPFTFAIKGEEYLIPVCCSPYVMLEEKIESIELTSDVWKELSTEEMTVRLYR